MMGEHPVRVLLIEDDPDDYLLTRDLLAEIPGRAFDLEWVQTYEAGLEALRRHRHDVYLLDYRLDGRTGLDFLREAVAAGCRAPVIVLTGQEDRAVDVEAMKAGAADYLIKGRVDAPLLERSIRYALGRKQAEEALRKAHQELQARREELEVRVQERTAELSEANARLAEADRRKDEFLAMLAHELRNPLAPILTSLHLLRRADTDRLASEQARARIERQIHHLTRLVDDLLDVSRITRGTVQLRREHLDLAQVVRTTAEDGRHALEQAGLRLALDVPQTPLWVWADATRLAQVLNNLLDNTVKFTNRGGDVVVRLQADAGQSQAVLSVRDTGIGIEAQVLPRLFSVFGQADQTLERTRGGLGLGLALVKGLVELHGGRVQAASAGPGQGAEFTVYFPLGAQPAAPAKPQAATPPTSGAGLRILVVEDHRDTADSMRLLLELQGHHVTVAYTGPDGVQAARTARPDIVLCDIGLPGMDGYTVAGELRGRPETARARLIAVTGYGQDEDRRRSRQAGFDAHLVKPVAPEVLEALLAAPAGA
jgi:signal transduction histidine kinase